MFLKIIKVIVALVIIFITGFIGASLVFSDYGPNETMLNRSLINVVINLIAGGLVGALFTRKWWLSGFVAWGSTLFFVVALIKFIIQTTKESPTELLFLITPLVAALIGGYLIKLIKTRISQT